MITMNFLRFIPNTLLNLPKIAPKSYFHSLTQESSEIAKPGGLFSVFTRNIIRIHFPRPSERKRIKRHGFKHRMSTPEGRRILMNRILKGKHVISH